MQIQTMNMIPNEHEPLSTDSIMRMHALLLMLLIKPFILALEKKLVIKHALKSIQWET